MEERKQRSNCPELNAASLTLQAFLRIRSTEENYVLGESKEEIKEWRSRP